MTMEPYFWLFLKIFPWLFVSGSAGLLIGWALRGHNLTSTVDRLENEAGQATSDKAKAEQQAQKLRKRRDKLETRVKSLEKSTAPRDEFEAIKSKLVAADSEIKQLEQERDSVRKELESFKKTSVSGADHSEVKRALERKDTQIRKAQAEAARTGEELKLLQAREVHDLVGFRDERDDNLKELRLENVRLREILVKVQAGDKKSLLQLADEARTGSAAAAAAAATRSAEDPLAEAALREENARLNGELETAKKKLLQVKGGGGGSALSGMTGTSIALERERDQLKVELAKARATGGQDTDAGLRSEISKLKKERDHLLLQLTEKVSATLRSESEPGPDFDPPTPT